MARPKLKFHEWRGIVTYSLSLNYYITNHAFNTYGTGEFRSLCGAQFHALNSPGYGKAHRTCKTCRELLPAAEKKELERQQRAFAREQPRRRKLIAEIAALLPGLWAFDLKGLLTQAKIDKRLADDRTRG